ncbi:glycosidase [Longilinea arvoryzae]|uniref:Glycosidase n=1 Tax=Longilinea arvoryzae TaxID=360412 RepID=A0A0S7BD02_9CHLR|nr:alpha-amylase family glycosyl hydrolase [Longilinea arvoryzae]GAP15598.1 glycosidase [Longilinea arvoryzae]
MPSKPAWLETAVFYQIYPQSFYDSNADGIGDLPGILAKLDYIQSLGVTGVWINPCFVSPFQDAGYDVSDYYRVAPRYGTNTDLQKLCAEANRRGMHILLDLVPGHTSIEHPWFQASCKHARNPYSDWFVWTDSVWTPPTPGLQNVRGYAERHAAYITNFFYFQPALNYGFSAPQESWQQPVDAPGPQAVRKEIRNIMQFWLDQGVSGFRVDMAGSLVKGAGGDKETARFWSEIRAWLDIAYPEAVLVSEWAQPATAIPAGFHMDFMLPFGTPGYIALWRKEAGDGPNSDPYGASYFDPSGRGNLDEFLDNYLFHYNRTRGQGHIAIPTGNHDAGPRVATGRSLAETELIYLFLLSLPGTPYIYYGDEIGMRSLEGLPSKEGGYQRTAIRTPMQWDATANAGFSSAPVDQLYLPIDPDPSRPTVAAQESDSTSLLQCVRRLVALRKAHPALCASGDFEVVYKGPAGYPFVFRREAEGESILVALNPSAQPCEVVLPAATFSATPEALHGLPQPFSRTSDGWKLSLPGISGGMYRLSK